MGYGFAVFSSVDGSVIVDENYSTYALAGSATPTFNSNDCTAALSAVPYTHYIDLTAGGAPTRPLLYYKIPVWNGNSGYDTTNGMALTGVFPTGGGNWRAGFVVPIGQSPAAVHAFVKTSDFSLPGSPGYGAAIFDGSGNPVFYSGYTPLWLHSNAGTYNESAGATSTGISLVNDTIDLSFLTTSKPMLAQTARDCVGAVEVTHPYSWILYKVYSWDATNKYLKANWATCFKFPGSPSTIAYTAFNGSYDTVPQPVTVLDGDYWA